MLSLTWLLGNTDAVVERARRIRAVVESDGQFAASLADDRVAVEDVEASLHLYAEIDLCRADLVEDELFLSGLFVLCSKRQQVGIESSDYLNLECRVRFGSGRCLEPNRKR